MNASPEALRFIAQVERCIDAKYLNVDELDTKSKDTCFTLALQAWHDGKLVSTAAYQIADAIMVQW